MINRSMKRPRIAILGATGLIGRSLTHSASLKNYVATAFSRDPQKAIEVFGVYGIRYDKVSDYKNFLETDYDVVINATGVGSPREIASNPTKVFRVTEEMDALILSYAERHPDCRVFNLSSGSVYGLAARQPITNETLASFDLSGFRPGDYYSLAKLYSEAKHRGASNTNIIDIRIFAFVSRFLDTEESFFIAEVAKCLKEGLVFKTKSEDMMRDYSTADDILDVIEFLSDKPPQNTAFDLRSLSPVGKFELLEYLSKNLGLKYEKQHLEGVSPTGEKNAYYSNSEKLAELGFTSNSSSLENIVREVGELLSLRK